jgi:hypothetical protein
MNISHGFMFIEQILPSYCLADKKKEAKKKLSARQHLSARPCISAGTPARFRRSRLNFRLRRKAGPSPAPPWRASPPGTFSDRNASREREEACPNHRCQCSDFNR